MNKYIIASSNKNKIREITSGEDCSILGLSDLGYFDGV